MELTHKEFAFLLGALRTANRNEVETYIEHYYDKDVDVLDDDELEVMCEKLNCDIDLID